MQKIILFISLCFISLATYAQPLPQESRVPGGVAIIPLTGLESTNAPSAWYKGNRVMVIPSQGTKYEQKSDWLAIAGIPLSAKHDQKQHLRANATSFYFQIEDKESLYIRTIAKAADLLAGNEDYDRASSYYDIIINKATETNLLKYSVKKYIFKATLCIFIISGRTLFKDIEKCKNKIENYVEQIPLYENSKEYVFLNNICLILEEDDVEEFINCAFLYDKAYKMDILSVGLLLKLKNMFREALAHNDQTGTNDFDNIDLS